ncbi:MULTISPECIES: hypothetical protein [unclassified Lacrimispora]|uniref:ORC-CDC6 family AAA ATPase n=1 Tax=unclassified Lacrimispora TaxID=2719232 RepID=UPI0037707236
MSEALIRTEDLTSDEVNKLFVDIKIDRENINALKSNQPLLLIGSRGTGKTMLMRKAEQELDDAFRSQRILPVYASFATSTIYDDIDLIKLMLNKILIALRMKLKEHGIIVQGSIFKPITYENLNPIVKKLETYIKALEGEDDDLNYTNIKPEINDFNIINNVDFFREFISDLCREYNINKIILMFDEACQIFSPNQQRDFFNLFRALRSPLIICKAAVYPGLVSYGTFQQFHDATTKKIERNILADDYIEKMREIVKNNYPNEYENMLRKGELLDTIIYCANGNPRFLLKSLNSILDGENTLKAGRVNEIIKDFYRATIWAEHTKLEERYKGHKNLINWSRSFIESVVSRDIEKINEEAEKQDEKKATICFAISRNAPEPIKQSIKILEYSGIATLDVEATKFRSKIYDRYQLNYGVVLLAGASSNLANKSKILIKKVSLAKFPNYSENSTVFSGWENLISNKYFDKNSGETLRSILSKNIDILDISPKLLLRLKNNNINIIQDIFDKEEKELESIEYIGPVRSRKIYNLVLSAVLEYISG